MHTPGRFGPTLPLTDPHTAGNRSRDTSFGRRDKFDLEPFLILDKTCIVFSAARPRVPVGVQVRPSMPRCLSPKSVNRVD